MAKLMIRRMGSPDKEVKIKKNVFEIGRVKKNDLCLKGDVKISRRHAKIEFIKGRFYIVDLQSANGTYVNDRLIRVRTEVKDGDKIVLGDTEMVFFTEGGVEEKPTEQKLEPVSPANIEELKKAGKPDEKSADQTDVMKKEEMPFEKTKPGPKPLNFGDEDSRTVNCPKCNSVIDVSSIPKGAKVGCAKCKHIFTV
ncbi:MAG: FHA domain-containing protein [Planctomycetota bacterium]|nr:FHA domain-containing protein [Planctomycetota bacterium]